MATTRNDRESLLELCPRVTDLAHSISIRFAEYLSTSKTQTHGFRGLAINFLEVMQTLWPIQAALLDTSHSERALPAEVILEIRQKVNHTHHDFSSLDLVLSKLMIYERKKGFGKFAKSFGMLSIDSDIQRLSESLAKDRDALRTMALAFEWVQGSHHTSYKSMGNAYANLAAKLKIANENKPMPPRPLQQSTISKEVPKLPEMSPVSDWASVKREQNEAARDLSLNSPSTIQLRSPVSKTSDSTLVNQRMDSLEPHRTLNMNKLQTEIATAELAQFHFSRNSGSFSETTSNGTVEPLIRIEEMLRSYEYEQSPRLPKTTYEPKIPTHRVQPAIQPNPQQPESTSATMKHALVAAVQHKNHKVVEELLDLGVSPENDSVSLVNMAITNDDVASLRLLLLFGADVNRLDHDEFTPLMHAVDRGATESVKVLLKYRADLNIACGPEDETPLGLAAAKGRLDPAKLLLAHGADVNAMMPGGNTPLIRAINKTTKLEMIATFIQAGANVNGKNHEGATPLVTALLIKRTDIVRFLLDSHANPNIPGPKHPLWPATYDPAALQIMIERGADLNKTPGIMELASSLNNIRSVDILIKAGVSPNVRKDGVYTPLCSAIRDDHAEIVTLLLKNGADPNLKASDKYRSIVFLFSSFTDFFAQYPAWKCITHDHIHYLPELIKAGADLHNPKGILETAVAYHHKEAVVFLLGQDIEIDAVNEEGYTALTTAIRDNSEEFVHLLLEHGASPIVRGQDWPLSMAVKRPQILAKLLPKVPKTYKMRGIVEKAVVANELASVKLLVENGASVEDKTGGVFSPLTSALRERHRDIVRYLIDEAGANVNAPGEHLPIVKAIRRCRGANDLEDVELLLSRGADINQVYRGWNAMMQAIETGDMAILRVLIEKGGNVDLDAVDETGKTVREFAAERGWAEGARMLLGTA